ncbi:MAG TPA: SDR family oxidoreductase [Polyangiaceae bacterium]|nr:SDR family oxidoreductase [Polyangiaceae bacterium]
MKVLVVGATGLLGTNVCKRLTERGHTVVGLVRSGSPKQAELRKIGVEVRFGDLLDAASLDAGCAGVEGVIATATAIVSKGSGNSLAAVDGKGYTALIAAAKRASVKRFVFISVSPTCSQDVPLIAMKRATERAIRESGMKWTILQPSNFMEIWLGPSLGWDLKAGKAQIFGKGEAPISWISLEDVGAYAVAALDSPSAENQTIPLGGPEVLTVSAALKTVESTLGKTFKVTRLPGFVPKIASALLRPLNPKLSSLMALGVQSLTGDVIDQTKQRSIVDVPLTSIEQYVRKAVS